MMGINVSGIVASHHDFACLYAAQWIKRGIGCYFDNAFPSAGLRPADHRRLPPARRPDPAFGRHVGPPRLHARIWTLHRQLGPRDALPAMMIHMTNTHIVPYMVWNDENLDLEWKFGPEPQQSKFHHAFLRAETLGRQSGNVPWALDRIIDAKTPAAETQGRRHPLRHAHGARDPLVGRAGGRQRAFQAPERFRLRAGRLPRAELLGRGLSARGERRGDEDAVAGPRRRVVPGGVLVESRSADGAIPLRHRRLGREAGRGRRRRARQRAGLLAAEGGEARAAAALGAAEEALAERQQALARNPLAWDARTATLTVGLDGYGVARCG